VGVCLFPKFLRDPEAGRATVDDAVRHIERIAEVGGLGCVASGADFDGIREMPEGISGIAGLGSIAEALRARGWREADVDAWRGGNAFRVLSELGE
jgi:membrane dipeptidase